MNAKDLFRIGLKAGASLFGGGIFFSVWLAVFLLVDPLNITILQVLLWLLAPLVTAAGFAAGVLVYGRLAGECREPFLRAMAWPLFGCVAGALAVYRGGPMLIVFAMLWAGTTSVALREAVALLRKAQS